MNTAAAANEDLLFRWEPPRRRATAFVFCLLGSALLHAFGFYLFQVIYPPTVALLPPPAVVSVISPATEDGRLLLRWVESEDPAVALTTQRPPNAGDAALPRVDHVPSFAQHEPQLLPLPFSSAAPKAEANPPAPVATPRPQQQPPLPPVATRVSFSSDIVADVIASPAPRFTKSISETPSAAEFRVGVAGDGTVRYALLTRSSGDGALDEQAHAALASCRFRSTEDATLRWSVATFEWGNDIATPAAASATPAATP